MEKKLYAVLTGDVAKSSGLAADDRRQLLPVLKDAFSKIESILGSEIIAFPFEVFRGDSFQGVLQKPELALSAAVLIRAVLRSSFKSTLKNAVDARIAIGIGSINLMPDSNSGEGDGEAYRNSGLSLDTMPKHARMMVIKTPWQDINDELNVECALLDTLISRWTTAQADVVLHYFDGHTQDEMASVLNISQPAIKKHIDSANIFELQLMIDRFTKLINNSNHNLRRL